MIAQSVGSGGKATIGFTVSNAELEKTKKTLAPIAGRSRGDARSRRGKVSKVSVVGAGMRAHTGVAERMFEALAADGINMKMITTGDIKISVLIEEDAAAPSERLASDCRRADQEGPPGSKKAVRGRKALRAVHAAFALAEPRKGAGVPHEPGGNGFRPRPNPLVVPGRRTARPPSPGSKAWRTCWSAASI